MHLLCLTGPPAVGKMTVGRAVCDRTGFRLFHNHMSIEPLLGIYDFGTPSFQRINAMIRREVIAESVVADLPGLVFTFAIDLDRPGDLVQLQELIAPVERAGAPIDVVELLAPQEVRLAREGGADRMDHKRSKRDVEWARSHVVDLESRARFTTDPERDGDRLLPGHRHLRLDNAHGDPALTADRIVTELGLPRL
ncbi:AAA family ATPase [Terrabacter sp. C0L_2]|uniref:AAA family ATPase n=1 Tax=Terrabacter sp. C0L_2 TaxID=3108389 RepID=UPI002ED6541E|nr:AAA family ATPase [Terrabacter sp. C0L_2]